MLTLLMMPGVCAAVIDIGTSWMFDLKEGICMNAFWLNREQCCWVANDTTFDQEGCAQVCVSVCIVLKSLPQVLFNCPIFPTVSLVPQSFFSRKFLDHAGVGS